MTYKGSRLILNAAIAEGGSLAVEVLDSQGDPIPGFTLAEADPLSGDSVAMSVGWNGGRNLSSLAGQSIRLRFVMNDVKLYAFQFVPEPAAAVGFFGMIVSVCATVALRRN